MSSFCYECGGNGFEDKACSECGRKPGSLNLAVMEEEEVKAYIKQTELISIPDEYVNEIWNREKFIRLYKGNYNLLLEKDYLDKIDLFHSAFADGMVPRKSAIIIAPAYHSKRTLAYSCMQFALRNGFTVAPILNTLELKRLLVLGSENPKYRLYETRERRGISFDEYITSDVLFVSVTQTEYHKNAFAVLEDIAGIRSAKGLPIYALSRYGLDEMSAWDRKKNMAKLKGIEPEANYKKFPSIIEYRESV